MITLPDWPCPPNIKSIITTRRGGQSLGKYGSLNLATHVDDDPKRVEQNRLALKRECEKHFQQAPEFYWLNQVHGTECVRFPSKETVPSEAMSLGFIPITADAAISAEPNHACTVLTADCLPVLFCDSGGTEVAAAHAGWRGLADGILSKTVEQFSSEAQSLIAYLGPAISQPAFQVGEDVRQAFLNKVERFGSQANVEAAFIKDKSEAGKYLADIYALARHELNTLGVNAIYGAINCTYSNRDYYSYRRDGVTGRFASAIWISAGS